MYQQSMRARKQSFNHFIKLQVGTEKVYNVSFRYKRSKPQAPRRRRISEKLIAHFVKISDFEFL